MELSHIRLLHVEDDPTDAMITQTILESSSTRGYFLVTQVPSLKEALHELAQSTFDAVLLDLHLSDVSGVDNVDAIYRESPHVPVIVLSSYDSDELAMASIDRGAQEYLVKGHSSGRVIHHAIHGAIRRKVREMRMDS